MKVSGFNGIEFRDVSILMIKLNGGFDPYSVKIELFICDHSNRNLFVKCLLDAVLNSAILLGKIYRRNSGGSIRLCDSYPLVELEGETW